MIQSDYKGLRISGLACCVPENKKKTDEYNERFGEDKVEKFINMTGVLEKHDALEKQTASDLAYVAARDMLERKGVDPETIGALVFVTETPDYQTPSTAFVLQHRLGLPIDSVCFDINLGCSGFVSGFNTLAALMATSNIERGLLLFGDTMTKKLSPQDRSIVMILGDAGGAMLLEKDDKAREIHTSCRSDGNKYQLVYIPAGAARNPDVNPERVEAEDGNIRGPYDFYMDGANIFFFSTSDAVKLLKEYMEANGKAESDYDALVLHQANGYILKNFAKKSKFPMEKVPVSIDRFGNTVGASIPVTLADKYGDESGGTIRLMMCGFGVGLSMALVDAEIDKDVILPMIYSDEYYEEEGK